MDVKSTCPTTKLMESVSNNAMSENTKTKLYGALIILSLIASFMLEEV